MKNLTVQLPFDGEKLDALRMFMGQKNLAPEAELEGYLDQLFEKHVPRQVQEFLLNKPAKQARPRPAKKTAEG